MASDVSSWVDTGGALVIAVAGASIAFFWASIQATHRARKFHRVIKRELQEVAPVERRAGTPWWGRLSRRFVHEEIFAWRNISANRDFLLTIHPDVLFAVSQLWIAFEKHDGTEWVRYLEILSTDDRVGSDELVRAARDWKRIVEDYLKDHAAARPARAPEEQAPHEYGALFAARLERYGDLLRLTRRDRGESDDELAARSELADKLTSWYYENGGGLLLSQESFQGWFRVRGDLVDETVSAPEIDDDFSALRTSLKIDLGVRHADERDVAAMPTQGSRSRASAARPG